METLTKQFQTSRKEHDMQLTPIGVDIAKNVFQVHYIEEETGEVINKQLKRGRFLAFFEGRAPCLIGMEACGGAHHWARQLAGLGHRVKLLPAQYVKAFNIRNKSDAADAEAIWRAVQQPAKEVAVKTEVQQAMLALHRMRSQLVKFRTAQVNCMRGLLAEYGEVFRAGRAGFSKEFPTALERLRARLPSALVEVLRMQFGEWERLDERIASIERAMFEWKKADAAVQAVSEIPGVGLLTATAVVATMGEAKAFKSGREFAAWVGLVPRHTGSGGKSRLGGISKRGDVYLRTLLVHGARNVLMQAKRWGKEGSPWVERLKERRPHNVAVVAMANKTARTIWALLAHGRRYEKGYVSMKPQTL
jgi:transposase